MATAGQDASTSRLRDHDWSGERVPRSVSGQELARGMTLLRASNLNVVRLQLAMERQDRRLAMEALDGLVALDGEIRDLVGAMPPHGDDALGALARRIDDQKAALASEKLVFAAGRSGPALAPKADPIAPGQGRPLGAAPDALGDEPVPMLDLGDYDHEGRETRRGRRIALVFAILFLLAAGAAGLYLLGIDSPMLLERLAAFTGGW